MSRIPGATTQTIPLTAQRPLRLRADGPLRLLGQDGEVARLRGIGAVQEQEGVWVLSGPATLAVPRWARVILEEGRGPVKAVGLAAGRLEVVSLTGPLKADAVQQVHLRAVTGPVRLSGPVAHAVLEAVTGAVKVALCPQILEARTTGPLWVHCPQPAGRRITLRVQGPVTLQVPAETRLHGRVRAAQQVVVAGVHQPPVQHGPTEVVWEAEDPASALHVDIVAEGSQGRVSIGPRPTAVHAEEDVGAHVGLGFARLATSLLGRLFGVGQRAARAARPTAYAHAPVPDPLEEARRRVLHMLVQGKITAAEADRLLDTLE